MPRISTICQNPHCKKLFTFLLSQSYRGTKLYCSDTCRYWRTPEQRFWLYVDTSKGPDACWPWTGALKGKLKGYGEFRIETTIYHAHRLSWIYANGDIPNGLDVLHTCDNPPCVNPAHLWLGTAKENMEDCAKKGRLKVNTLENCPHGSAHANAKLSEEKVRQAHAMRSTHTTQQIADYFQVYKSTIEKIFYENTWKHVKSF